MVAPGGTAVWLPGLGDRWPQYRRLCLPSTHAHLSSASWGGLGRQGWGPPLLPPPNPRGSAAPRGAPGPFLIPAPSSQPPHPSPSPSPSKTWTPTNQSVLICFLYPLPPCPGGCHADPPLKGPFRWAALSMPLGVPTQCLGVADMTACCVQSLKPSREDSLFPGLRCTPALPCSTRWPSLSPGGTGRAYACPHP